MRNLKDNFKQPGNYGKLPILDICCNILHNVTTSNERKVMSSIAVRLSEEIVQEAKKYAKIESRSVPKQIEYWVKIGKAAQDNPDLPISFIEGAFKARKEIERGECTPFDFKQN